MLDDPMQYTPLLRKRGGGSVVMGIEDTLAALLYELAFTVTRSVSGYCGCCCFFFLSFNSQKLYYTCRLSELTQQTHNLFLLKFG